MLSLNIILVADEFGVQDVRRADKLNSELYRGRTYEETSGAAELHMSVVVRLISSARVSYIISRVWEGQG